MEDVESGLDFSLEDKWGDSLRQLETSVGDRIFPDNHVYTIQNCAASSQNKMQIFIP